MLKLWLYDMAKAAHTSLISSTWTAWDRISYPPIAWADRWFDGKHRF
jgi:hypothetical protein